jgi:polyhydroxyalkanoate synthesis regulator phasin
MSFYVKVPINTEVSATNLATKDQVSELNSRIHILEKKLEKFEDFQAKEREGTTKE